MNQKDFQQTLKNYRDGVNQVLPDYVNGRVNDSEALADELGLVLYSRDVLARALAASHPLALRHLSEIERLDQKFLTLKKGQREKVAHPENGLHPLTAARRT